jgi:hypothetical protein
MKRPADPAEAQQWLIKFGRQVAEWAERERTAGISPDYAEWALGAISENLISGTELGQAFGLVRTGAGRPVDEENREWALKVHPHLPLTGRANWKTIARAVDYPGKPENLRKLYDQHFDEMQFAIRALEKEIAEGMKEENKKRASDNLALLEKARAKITRH